MNFEYNEEQQIFSDSIGKFLADNYDFEQRNKIIQAESPFSTEIWQEVAELGWLAMLFSEEDGGFDGTAIDLMVVFEQLGKHLVVEPFLETLVLGGGLLRRLSNGRFSDQISALMEGQYQCTLAHEENSIAPGTTELASKAEESSDGYKLNGEKNVVYNAEAANDIIVSAMLNGELALFLVPKGTAGLNIKAYNTVDACRAAELSFEGLELNKDALIASGEEAVSALNATIDDAILAAAAEQVGMMRSLLDITIEYTKERKQFGTAISNFQVLQHRMADMYIAMELTVSLMYTTAIKMRDQSADAGQYVAALKVKADKSAREVAHGAFQLHGAMATTSECSVGHFLKRVTTLAQRFGGTNFHLQRYIAETETLA